MSLAPAHHADRVAALRELYADMAIDWPAGAFSSASPERLAELAEAEAEVDEIGREEWVYRGRFEAALQALALALTRIRREAVERLRGG